MPKNLQYAKNVLILKHFANSESRLSMLPDFLLISNYLNLKMSVYVMLGPDTFSTDASKNYAFLKNHEESIMRLDLFTLYFYVSGS